MSSRYALGLDFGTESARALLVNVEDGEIAATAVSPFAHGVMDTMLPDETPLGYEWALQSPDDYLDSLTATVSGLGEGTDYYWQVRAVNAGGITYADGDAAAFWAFATQPEAHFVFLPVVSRE